MHNLMHGLGVSISALDLRNVYMYLKILQLEFFLGCLKDDLIV